MLLLTSITDLVRVITGSAADIEVYAAWMDVTGTPPVVTPGRTITPSITTAATTTVVGSPAASTQRNVKHLNITNNHASAQAAVAVEIFDGTNAAELIEVVLLAGENLVLNAEGSWTHYGVNGIPISDNPAVRTIALAGDQSNSTVTPTNVAGLSLAAVPGVYQFYYTLIYQAAALTTGVRFDVNFGGTVTSFVWNQRWSDLSATAATAVPDQDNIGAAGHVMGSFASRAKGTAGRGTTLSVDAINADMLMIIEGTMVVTVAGNLELWHGSEVAAASTVKAGSSLVLIKV